MPKASEMNDYDGHNVILQYLEATGIIILALNKKWEITLLNKNGCDILGYDKENIIGENWIERFVPYPKRIKTGVYKHLEKRKLGNKETFVHFEYPILTKDRRMKYISWHKTLILDEKEDIIAILGFGKDLTEEKSFTEELAQSRKMASVGRLAAGVAHEVNTPLANIEFLVANMKKKVNDPYILGKLKRVEGQTRQAGVIVKDLLSFSRRAVPIPEKTDITRLVSNLGKEYKESIPENIELVLNLESTPFVMADQRLLGQVFNNMIDNAIDAMPDGGILTISVDWAEEKEGVRISFRDSGSGIQKENLDKIFDPFFTTKSGMKGTGLGLSICHGIVEAHGGRIVVDSTPGKGSYFRIILPTQGV